MLLADTTTTIAWIILVVSVVGWIVYAASKIGRAHV